LSKNPKIAFTPHIRKEPRTATDPSSYNQQHPSWRIADMELIDPFGWHKLGSDKIRAIREKLGHFESMTWNEILIAGKKRNHSVSTAKLCAQAQKRLREIGQNDLEELVSLRLSGPERVWGILRGGVLTVLWWDPEHKVCPSLPL
jgi:hypothetical protein